MKKKIVFFALALALALTAAGTAVAAAEEPAPAQIQEQTQPPAARGGRQSVSVTGCGKVTVPADAAVITFRVRAFADTLAEGRQRLAEAKNALLDGVRAAAGGAEGSAPCGDPPPVRSEEAGGYVLTGFVSVKIADLSAVPAAERAGEEKGERLQTCYLLEAESEAVRRALSLAEADAEAKAAALLGKGAKLVRLREECCWHCPADTPGQMTVCANVRAGFVRRETEAEA